MPAKAAEGITSKSQGKYGDEAILPAAGGVASEGGAKKTVKKRVNFV